MLYMNQMPDAWADDVLTRIGQNIRKKRTEAGWSLNQMYDETGISRQTIFYWESKQRAPRIDDLLWMCERTGWELSDILGGGK